MFNAFYVLPMEYYINDMHDDLSVETVRDLIDENHLGINSDRCFRSIIGAYSSWRKSSNLTNEEVIAEMDKIESYIKLEDKERVLKKLDKRHWYVNYLFQTLINAKIEEFKKVKGSTIDALYNFIGENGFKRIVHQKAFKLFFDSSGIESALLYFALLHDAIDKSKDIHCINLLGHTNEIHPTSLVISFDNKYLRSTDCENNEIVWNMQKGVKVDLPREECDSIKWTVGSAYWYNNKQYCVIDSADNYYAYNSKVGDKPAITLCKRPQEISYLCQQAFNNNMYDRSESIILFNSESFTKTEGFPQDNLKRLMEKRHVFEPCLTDKKAA